MVQQKSGWCWMCINWPILVLSRALVGSAQVHVSNWIKIKKSNQPGSPVLGLVFFTCILEKCVLNSSQKNLMCLNFGSIQDLLRCLSSHFRSCPADVCCCWGSKAGRSGRIYPSAPKWRPALPQARLQTRTLTYFLPLHRGKTKRTSRSLSDSKGSFRLRPEGCWQNKENTHKNTRWKSQRLPAGWVGTFHSATGPAERAINNGRDLDNLSEVQGLDPFMVFRPAWASSPRMCSTWEGSSGMISFHLTGNPEYGSGRHRVEKLGQTTRWMLAASICLGECTSLLVWKDPQLQPDIWLRS